jgi:hypothetical protein
MVDVEQLTAVLVSGLQQFAIYSSADYLFYLRLTMVDIGSFNSKLK